MSTLIADLPLWILIAWIIVSFGVTYWLYLPKSWLKELPPLMRYTMFSLRFIGLTGIGILLIGFLLQDKSYTKEKPVLLTLIDNSSSMLNYADSVSVRNSVEQFTKELPSALSTEFNLVTYTLNDLHTLGEPIDFNAKKTHLAQFFQTVYDSYYGRNIGAVILVSDGNYNTGTNPIVVAGKLKMTPIYTLGVGDTLQKKDQLIANVNHNDIAFLGNKFPIEVTVEGSLMQGTSTQLFLKQNGKIIAEENVVYNGEISDLHKVTFYVEAEKVGFVSYQLVLASVDGETNYENNTKTVYIEVLDSRSKVLLVGGAPHPDLGAIKHVLARDNNLEVSAIRINDLPENLAVYDLIICHEPGVGLHSKEMERLRDAKAPIWYVFGTQTRGKQFSQLGLPVVLNNAGQTDVVSGAWNQMFNKFELSDAAKDAFRKFPPLTIPYGKLQLNQAVDVLFYQQVGPVIKKDPLFFITHQNERKIAITLGEGIWRWKLSEFQRNKNNKGFNELIEKTVQYLAVKANTSRLRIQLPTTFNEDESIVLSASFYNESFEPVTNVPIELTLTNAEGQETMYDFVPKSRNYSLNIGTLPSGSYSWKAVATDGQETFTKSGSFMVKKLELEALETRANHNLLYRIAQNSGASFFQLADYQQVFEAINQREDVAPVSYESITFKKLIDYKWIFFLLVLIFGLEWFLRRYLGGY